LKVIFIHFSRGTTKTHGGFDFKARPGALTVEETVEFCERHVLGE